MPQIFRSFFAIELPGSLKGEIDAYIDQLKTLAGGVKWVRSGSLHITIKFLGDQPAAMVERAALAGMELAGSCPPFSISVTGFGAFPNRHKPRVFWLGIQSTPQQPLYQLQSALEELLEPLGFEKENRRFSPHLTLGRVKRAQSFSDLLNFVDDQPFGPVTFEPKELVLMRSILKPQGAVYQPIQKYALH